MPDDSTMCATVEIIKYKPGKLQSGIDLGIEIQSELRAIPGRKHLISVWNDDGVEYVLSVWESPEAKAAGAAEVDRLGAKFGDIFEQFEAKDFQNVLYWVGS